MDREAVLAVQVLWPCLILCSCLACVDVSRRRIIRTPSFDCRSSTQSIFFVPPHTILPVLYERQAEGHLFLANRPFKARFNLPIPPTCGPSSCIMFPVSTLPLLSVLLGFGVEMVGDVVNELRQSLHVVELGIRRADDAVDQQLEVWGLELRQAIVLL